MVLPVCEDCYLHLVSLNEASGSTRLLKYNILKDESKIKGTGRLRPENIMIRYNDTIQRIEDNELA